MNRRQKPKLTFKRFFKLSCKAAYLLATDWGEYKTDTYCNPRFGSVGMVLKGLAQIGLFLSFHALNLVWRLIFPISIPVTGYLLHLDECHVIDFENKCLYDL